MATSCSRRGAVAFSGVELVGDGAVGPRLVFGEPSDGDTPPRLRSGSGDGVVSLACCLSNDGVVAARLLDLARRCGPLFGALLEESAAAWARAAQVAHVAVTLQEVVNGTLPVAATARLANLEKRTLAATSSGATLDYLVISRAVEAEYRASLSSLPVMVRAGRDGGGWCYAFAALGRDPGSGAPTLDLSAFSLPHEMSLADWRAVRSVIEADDGLDGLAVANLRDDGEGSDFGFLEGAEYQGGSSAVDANDVPALSALVRAIAAAHVVSAEVDPFGADDDTGYLAFPSHLAWMWYDFSRSLSRVRVGYCARCGQAYSLVGRRGADRSFCSRECKTEQVNDRNRQLRDGVRSDFAAGMRVGEIATSHGTSATYVRLALSTWPRLKRMLDESIETHGVDGSPLFAHCRDEGLDMARLLHVRHHRT